MKLGLCCMMSDSKFKKGYSGITQCRNRQNNDKLVDATLNNILETRKCLEFVISNNIGMYRFSSDIIPFDSEWDWDKNPVIVSELIKLGNIIKKHNIRATIHPSQFCVINSTNSDVIKNSFDILKHHYVLAQYLNIEGIIIHTGSAKDNYVERFITNARKLPRQILDMLYLENCHSVSIDTVIDICSELHIKPIFDLHHNRVYGNVNIDNVIPIIATLWNGLTPIGHISSGKTSDNDKSHHDYIIDRDIQLWKKYFNVFDFEVEAKLKDKAILKILEVMQN